MVTAWSGANSSLWQCEKGARTAPAAPKFVILNGHKVSRRRASKLVETQTIQARAKTTSIPRCARDDSLLGMRRTQIESRRIHLTE
jgi:hypothetical protein